MMRSTTKMILQLLRVAMLCGGLFVSTIWGRQEMRRPRRYSLLSAASFIHPVSPPTTISGRSELAFRATTTPLISSSSRQRTRDPVMLIPEGGGGRKGSISSSFPASSSSALFARKKKGGGGGGGGGASSVATKKVQVKLLKHVAGTGQAGDVIQVAPAFFQNKLRPTKSAVVITDDEVAAARAEKQAAEADLLESATRLRETISGMTLELQRNAGPDGQLFGGIGPKVIVEELKNAVSSSSERERDFFVKNNRGVKILAINDVKGKKMRGDIKHTGEYSAIVALTKDISAKFAIAVTPS